MGDFVAAVSFVLANEKNFVDNQNDSGGATNFGVSLRLLKSLSIETLRKCGIFRVPDELGLQDIKDLTIDQAKLVYKFVFWSQAPFEKLEDQDECNYIFDMAVNHGTNQAIKLVQRAIWDVHRRVEYNGLLDDGVLGEETLAEIEGISSYAFMQALIVERIGLMRLLVAKNPKDREFLNGWLNRCYRI